jgi:multiple sugar transport system permease protein
MLVLATLMIPPVVIMAPLYVVFRSMGLIGSLIPLWLPSCFGGAFSIFLLRQFFTTIPRELDEAARIDGCGHAGIFARVIIPSSLPALAAVALMQFNRVMERLSLATAPDQPPGALHALARPSHVQ